MQLHQLAHFEFHTTKSPGPQGSEISLARVIRWLSVEHQLRSFSLVTFSSDDNEVYFQPVSFFQVLLLCTPDLQSPLLAHTIAAKLASQQPSFQDWSLPCALTDVCVRSDNDQRHFPSPSPSPSTANFFSFANLPHLTRLRWVQQVHATRSMDGYLTLLPANGALSACVRSTLARLQQLSINLNCNRTTPSHYMRYLLECRQLRVLHLHTRASLRQIAAVAPLEASVLQQGLAVWAPTIEEIRITGYAGRVDYANYAGATAQYDAEWNSLHACHQLRVLELPLQTDMPEAMLCALASLPVFHTLELKALEEGGASFAQTPAPSLLSSMCSSSSWRNLHLHHAPNQRSLIMMVMSSQLASLQQPADRIRIYSHLFGHSQVECYRASKDDQTNAQCWQQIEFQ